MFNEVFTYAPCIEVEGRDSFASLYSPNSFGLWSNTGAPQNTQSDSVSAPRSGSCLVVYCVNERATCASFPVRKTSLWEVLLCFYNWKYSSM